jgi:hypothetical protein
MNARDTITTMWYKKPIKDRRFGRDVGKAQNATMVHGIEA